jgi:membrane protein implicated in regulation of membrane protease activity
MSSIAEKTVSVLNGLIYVAVYTAAICYLIGSGLLLGLAISTLPMPAIWIIMIGELFVVWWFVSCAFAWADKIIAVYIIRRFEKKDKQQPAQQSDEMPISLEDIIGNVKTVSGEGADAKVSVELGPNVVAASLTNKNEIETVGNEVVTETPVPPIDSESDVERHQVVNQLATAEQMVQISEEIQNAVDEKNQQTELSSEKGEEPFISEKEVDELADELSHSMQYAMRNKKRKDKKYKHNK